MRPPSTRLVHGRHEPLTQGMTTVRHITSNHDKVRAQKTRNYGV
jgi:hypothetical protein